jgi:hypothetical protein
MFVYILRIGTPAKHHHPELETRMRHEYTLSDKADHTPFATNLLTVEKAAAYTRFLLRNTFFSFFLLFIMRSKARAKENTDRWVSV